MFSLSARLLMLLAAFAPGIAGLFDSTREINVVVALLGMLTLPFLILNSSHPRLRLPGGTGVLVPRSLGVAATLGVVFLALQCWALARGFFSEQANISELSRSLLIMALIFIYACYTAMRASDPRGASVLHWTMMSIGLLCVVNLFFWLIGVTNAHTEGNAATSNQAGVLAMLGLDFTRVYFPLSWGVNTFGSACGMALAYGTLYFTTEKKQGLREKLIHLGLLFFAPLICLLLTDTRGAMLFAFLAWLLAVCSARVNLFLIVAFVAGALTLVLNSDLANSTAGLARDSTSSVLSGRDTIWLSVISELSSFKPVHLYGFGAYGQAESGISSNYSQLFQGWSGDSELVHVHNGLLQVIIDTGYLGGVVLIGFVVFAYIALSRKSPGRDPGGQKLGRVVLNFLVLQSLSEVIFTMYQPWTFFGFCALVFTFRSEKMWAWSRVQSRSAVEKGGARLVSGASSGTVKLQ